MNYKIKISGLCPLLIMMSFLYLKKVPLSPVDDLDWAYYGGNNAGNCYSSLNQINSNNVKDLKVEMYTCLFKAENKKGIRNLRIPCSALNCVLLEPF